MIRINLLPPEDRTKRRQLHLPNLSTIYLVAGVAVFFAAILITGFMQQHRIKVLEQKIEQAKKESRELAPQLAKIKQITKEREEVNRRLGIIASLDRNRYYRVKLLSDISFSLPANCWLTDVAEVSPNNFNIDGIAFSNYTVANIMQGLESSNLFTKVDLIIAEKGRINERNVMKFQLGANLLPQ